MKTTASHLERVCEQFIAFFYNRVRQSLRLIRFQEEASLGFRVGGWGRGRSHPQGAHAAHLWAVGVAKQWLLRRRRWWWWRCSLPVWVEGSRFGGSFFRLEQRFEVSARAIDQICQRVLASSVCVLCSSRSGSLTFWMFWVEMFFFVCLFFLKVSCLFLGLELVTDLVALLLFFLPRLESLLSAWTRLTQRIARQWRQRLAGGQALKFKYKIKWWTVCKEMSSSETWRWQTAAAAATRNSAEHRNKHRVRTITRMWDWLHLILRLS